MTLTLACYRPHARKTRLEAESSGKQLFAYQAFLAAYNKVSPNPPSAEEMELEYDLDHRSARNLDEFLAAVWQKELYDGGDMHLDL